MIIKTILKFLINSIHVLGILFLSNIFMDCTYAAKSNEANSIDQNNKIPKAKRSNGKNSKDNSLANSTDENIIFINRRASSFSKIKNFIPKIHPSLKRRKSNKIQSATKNSNFKSYVSDSPEQTSIRSLDAEEGKNNIKAISIKNKNKDNTSNINNCNFNSSSPSYQQAPSDIEGNNIYLNRFMGKIIQLTSDGQPYLIETQEESPSINNYMDMDCFFINRVGNLIPKNAHKFFYKGYYVPQIIILGSIKLDSDSKNNKIIYADEYCRYETIISTTCKKLINHMMLRIGEPFKNIHANIEIESHSYYIRNMYLSICILKKIQLTIIYPEKNVSHNMLEINNLSYQSIRQYFKNIIFPIELTNEINDYEHEYEYDDYEKKILFLIESQRHTFDNFDAVILELGNPSLYGLKVINMQMNYVFIEALNNLKISLYSFESKKPENIKNRKIIYEYSGYYILAINLFFADQVFTRYIKINGFKENTSEAFDLITSHIKYKIYDIFTASADKENSFIMLLSLLVCYNQQDNFINHDDSTILQFEEFVEDIYNLQFEEFTEDTDSIQFENLPNCDKLDNIYENSDIYLRQNQGITEIYNIEDIIKDIDLIAISIPTLLIINIINSKLL